MFDSKTLHCLCEIVGTVGWDGFKETLNRHLKEKAIADGIYDENSSTLKLSLCKEVLKNDKG